MKIPAKKPAGHQYEEASVQSDGTLLSPEPENLAHDHILKTLQTGRAHSPYVHELPKVEVPRQMVEQGVPLGEDQLLKLRKKNICLTALGAVRVEAATRQQARCVMWHDLRKKRITASNFGAIVNRRSKSIRIVYCRNCKARPVTQR